MPIVQSASFNPASLVVPDLYISIAKPTGTIISGINTGVGGVIGGASWGPVNSPITMGNLQDISKNFGPRTIGANDMPTDAFLMFVLGAQSVVGVRVTDGTDVQGTGNLTSPGTAATDTITISGTVTAGNIVTATVNGYSASYTVLVADTVDTIATAVATALTANVAIAAVVSAVAGAGAAIVTLTALQAGTAGNNITVTATVTKGSGASATVTATAATATLTGGAAGTVIAILTALYSGTEGNNISAVFVPGANSTTTAPTWTLQLSRSGVFPVSEVYPNLAQASLANSVINALANGLGAARGPSALCSAVAGTTPDVAPSQVAVSLTGGTNGDAAITSAEQIGSNTVTPPTGMYALAGSNSQVFFLSGNTDSNTWGLMAAFAATIGALAVLSFPANTTTSGAVTLKNAAGIDSPYVCWENDWVQFFDTYVNSSRLISPSAAVAGQILSLSPQFSPANKPIGILTGTTRTIANSPYTSTELATLISNGINVITNINPGGNFFGMRSSQNGSSNATTGSIEYTRMTNFLALSLGQNGLLGKYVYQIQTTSPNDPTRASAQNDIQTFLTGLKGQGMIQTSKVDMSFGTGKVNTLQSVQQGFMNANVAVQYLNTIKFFVVNLVAGSTVNVSVA